MLYVEVLKFRDHEFLDVFRNSTKIFEKSFVEDTPRTLYRLKVAYRIKLIV